MSLTYPDEAWPTATEIESLDATTDEATGLPYIAKGTGPTSEPSYEVQYNRRQQRENAILAPWRQGMVVREASLTIGAYPMYYTIGDVWKTFGGATGVDVPDNATRMVYLDDSETLQIAQSWPSDPSTFMPLALVTTSNGQMAIQDRRTHVAYRVPAASHARRVVSAHRSNVGANESDTEIFRFDSPDEMLLDQVQIYCTATSATATVDVKEAGASVLAAPATPVAGSVVKPVVSDGSIQVGTAVTVHVTTNASGNVTDLSVSLVARPAVPA